MSIEQTHTLTICGIVIGCAVVLLLLGILCQHLSEKKRDKKVVFKDDGQSPGDMFVGNGLGVRMLGSFTRNYSKAITKDDYYNQKRKKSIKAKGDSTKGDTDDHMKMPWLGKSEEEIRANPELLAARKKYYDRIVLDLQKSYDEGYNLAFSLSGIKVVGYEFFCIVVPLIPLGCYAYTVINESSRRTRYRFYGSQKWYFSEVLSIMLTGWAGVGIVGGLLGILSIFIF